MNREELIDLWQRFLKSDKAGFRRTYNHIQGADEYHIMIDGYDIELDVYEKNEGGGGAMTISLNGTILVSWTLTDPLQYANEWIDKNPTDYNRIIKQLNL